MSRPPLPPPTAVTFRGHDGLRLVADSWGEPGAPPVVFLHGGGQTRYAWRRTAVALAGAGWHAHSLDMRGHGESDWCPGGNYALGAFVADLEAVLATFGPTPTVVGASLGGLTALLGAGESEDFRAGAIVLVDIAPKIEAEGAGRIVEFMRARPDGYASVEEVADAVAAYLPHRPREKNVESMRRYLRRGEDGRYRWHWDPAFIGPGGPAELTDKERLLRAAGNVAAPTLLVRGRESDVLSEEGVAEFRAAHPAAEYVDVSGAGHMVVGDRNDAFTDAVAGFLRRHAAP